MVGDSKQRQEAVVDRINDIVKDLSNNLDKKMKSESIKPQPRHPQNVLYDWILEEMAVILFNQEQLTQSWNKFITSGDRIEKQ